MNNDFLLNNSNYNLYDASSNQQMETNGPVGLIALPGTEDFVNKVNNHLYNIRIKKVQQKPQLLADEIGFMRNTYIISSTISRFSSGEAKGTLNDTVRGHDLYIFCDITNHNASYEMFGMQVPMSPDEHFQNLKRIILAANNKARKINVVMPYLYQGLQDVRHSRESLDCANMLKELNNLGVHVIMTYDPHEPRVENAIPLFGIENVPTAYNLIRALISDYPSVDFADPEQAVVISPDERGMKRATYYASVLGLQVGTFFRQKVYKHDKNSDPDINYKYLGKDLEGKTAIIIDDIIFSGSTVTRTAKALKEDYGASNIIMLCTYPLMTQGTALIDKAYEDGYISKIYGTNLTNHTEELLNSPWYRDVDLSSMTSQLIDALNHQASISGVLDQSPQITELLQKNKELQSFNIFNN